MKKLFFTALLAISASVSAFATDTNNANSAAVSNFENTFTKASEITWTTNKDYSKATFVLNSVRMEALYTLQGDFIGTTKGITLDELPVSAKRDFAKKYAGYTVTEAIRFEGIEEGAYFVSAKNEKETVVLKVSDGGLVSVVKSTKNQN